MESMAHGSSNREQNPKRIRPGLTWPTSTPQDEGDAKRIGLALEKTGKIQTRHIEDEQLCLLDMGVDQKVLARSHVFGGHRCLFKSLCERSAMEFAKEACFVRERFCVGFLEACLCTCTLAGPNSIVDREMHSTFKYLHP